MVGQLLVYVFLHVYLILQKQADTYGRTASGTCNSGYLFDPTEVG